jgi:predicted transposase YbfD/YdcC
MKYSTDEGRDEKSENGVAYELGSVYERLWGLRDIRKSQGKRYSLVTILMLILLAKLSGEDKPVEIADWAKNNQAKLVDLLKLEKDKMPHHNTYRRILAYSVYVDEIERMVGEYNQTGKHGQVYAMDGKAMRGKQNGEETGTEYLLSVYDVEESKVMLQVAVGRKENEITKASKTLERVKIAQKVITGDAMHTQRGISARIIEAEADYVWPVKENQPRLYQNIRSLFAPEYPKPGFGKIPTDFINMQTVNKAHGRIETRTITTSEMMNTYAAWPGLAQVYRLQRDFIWRRNGKSIKTTSEVEYGITSLTRNEATPLNLMKIRRAHWGIETGLHYRRDVTFKEDATRLTLGNAAQIMASIHNLVISLIRQAGFQNAAKARRWFAGHLDIAFALLTHPTSRL